MIKSDDNFLIIATGTNIGNRAENLKLAKELLAKYFTFTSESKIYESPAVDYLNQPDFYNQVLQFERPPCSAEQIMQTLLNIEKKMGRDRIIPKGPRTIDLDLIFLGLDVYQSEMVQIPHPRLFERSFVVLPLSELPAFSRLKQKYVFSFKFSNHATQLS